MEVAFHFNVSQPTDYCCRLLRKAHARGARVTVTGPRVRLQDIDQQLWALSATEFVPQNNWVINGPRICAFPLVQIRSTNTCCFNLNNYIAISTNWAFNFTYFNAMRFR